MKVRPFRLSDALPLMELWEEILPQKTEALKLLTEQLSNDSDLVLVAEIDKNIVGVIVGTVSGTEALVHRIAVLPNHRGQGIGKLLLKTLEQRCLNKGTRQLYCCIDHYNELALSFYRAMGIDSHPHQVQIIS
jgi:ribosomal protein S18 acetylase RimI-like enzyme